MFTSSVDKPYRDASFLFKQNLAPAHNAKTTTKWFANQYISQLAGPETHKKSMGCCQEEDKHPTQKYSPAEGRYQNNLGFNNTLPVPQADYATIIKEPQPRTN